MRWPWQRRVAATPGFSGLQLRIPIRASQHVTSLPDPLAAEMSGLRNLIMANHTAAIHHADSGGIFWRSANTERAAWDDAIKSIERRHAAEEEWPWPTRL